MREFLVFLLLGSLVTMMIMGYLNFQNQPRENIVLKAGEWSCTKRGEGDVPTVVSTGAVTFPVVTRGKVCLQWSHK